MALLDYKNTVTNFTAVISLPMESDASTPSTVSSTLATQTASSLGPYINTVQNGTTTTVRSRKAFKRRITSSIILNPSSSLYSHTMKAGVEKFLARYIDELYEDGKLSLNSEIRDVGDVDFVFYVKKNSGRSFSFRFANWIARTLGRDQVLDEDMAMARESYLEGLKNLYKVSYTKISTPDFEFFPIKLSFYHFGLLMQMVGYQWRISSPILDKIAYKTFYFLKRDVERYHEYHSCKSREDFSARWRYDLTYNFLVGANVPAMSVNPWRTMLKHNNSNRPSQSNVEAGDESERAGTTKTKYYSLLHLFADELFDDWLVPHSPVRERTLENVRAVIDDIKTTGDAREKCCTYCCFPCWTCQREESKTDELADRIDDTKHSPAAAELCNGWRSFFYRNAVDCMDIYKRPHENEREFLGRISTIRNAVTQHSFPSPIEEDVAGIKHILPLKTVVNYLGEKIGFYFGWIELLIQSLTVPSLLGTLMFICGVCYYSWDLLWGTGRENPPGDPLSWVLAKACDNYATPAYAAIMVIWGTTFYEIWQRREKWYAYFWRVEKLEYTELERPAVYSFKTTMKLRRSKIFRPIVYVPSFVITLFFIILVFVSVYFINVIGVFSIPYCPKAPLPKDTANSTATAEPPMTQITANYSELMLNASTTPKEKIDKLICNLFSAAQVIANSISMFVLDFIYTSVCYILTDWESHQTQSSYTNALVIKLFTFRFFNYYTVLFYIAFGIAAKTVQYPDELTGGIHFDYEGFGCGEQPCMAMLSRQLLSVIVTKPLINSLVDVILPAMKYIYLAIKQRTMPNRAISVAEMSYAESADSAVDNEMYDTATPITEQTVSREPTTASQFDRIKLGNELEKQAYLTQLSTLDRREFTTEEYCEKVIVYGALLMFSVALPPAPALAIIIMRIDLNLDIGRIMNDFRRPIPLRTQNIGMWGPIVNFLTYLGILTNPLIVILTSSWGTPMPLVHKFFVFLGFEHVVFAIRMLVSFAVPDVPKRLVREQLIHKATKDELQSLLMDARIEQAGAKNRRRSRVGSDAGLTSPQKPRKLETVEEDAKQSSAG